MMKLWESEHFTLNFLTGELERVISDIYFEGVNFEQGQLSLIKSNKPWLRLTGNWFKQSVKAKVFKELENNLPIVEDNINKSYESLINPKELVKNMTDDEFLDWLHLGTEEDVKAALSKFKECNMGKYIGYIIGHLKEKYGKKDDEGSQQSDQCPSDDL